MIEEQPKNVLRNNREIGKLGWIGNRNGLRRFNLQGLGNGIGKDVDDREMYGDEE